jgi:hypothetical protein
MANLELASGWLLDTGAQHNMANLLCPFAEIEMIDGLEPVILGNLSKLHVLGIGSVALIDDFGVSHLFKYVLDVPKLSRCLLSVYHMLASGYDLYFSRKTFRCNIIDENDEKKNYVEAYHSLWIYQMIQFLKILMFVPM